MAKLAEEMLGCTSAVLDMRDSNSKDILLKHLASNHPVLVPYPFSSMSDCEWKIAKSKYYLAQQIWSY